MTPDQVDQLEALVLDLGGLTATREGLSRTAAATLGRLRDSGPTRLTELAATEGVSQPSMSALVGRLADHGLLQRSGDPRDARVVLLSLTPAGEQLVAQRRAARAERLEGALAALPPADVGAIADALPALSRLADALRRRPIRTEVTR